MSIKTIRCIVLFLLASVVLTADQITITGNYLDKKNNPIAGASVEYFSNIIQLDSAGTDRNGYFMLQIQTVGIETEPLPNRFHLGQNYPNPFNPETRTPVATPYPVTLSLFNIRGQLIDKINIPVGRYDIVWGGLDRNGKPVSAGIYFLLLEGNDVRLSRRITLLDGGGQSRLRIEKHQSTVQRSGLAKAGAVDEIRFTKPNTSIKILQLTSPAQDTSLGVITGNVGPTILQTIPYDSCYTDQYRDWDLNSMIYNDGDSRFSLKDTAEFYFQYYPHILKFQSYTSGNFSTTLYIDDITDPSLKDSMQLKYKVLPGGSPGTLPWQFADIPDMTINEDDTLKLDMLQYVCDGRWPDICRYGIDSLPNATFINELSDVWIIPEPDYHGVIDSIVIWVKDMAHSQRVYLRPFNLTITPVNDAPRLTLEVLLESVGEDTTGLPIAIANFTVFDPDTGRDGFFDIYNFLTHETDDILITLDGEIYDIMEQSGEYEGQVFLEKLTKDVYGEKDYGVGVCGSDNNQLMDQNSAKLTVEPRDEPIINVTFRFKAAYPDTLLGTGVNTLQLTPLDDALRENPITEFQEVSVEDNAYITAQVSCLMDVWAMNSNSADGHFGEKYLFLKKGSYILEQRCQNDTVSVVDFSELADGDTVDVYKMMDEYQINRVVRWLTPYAFEGTRIFPRGSTVTVWWNTGSDYLDPDSTYLAWTREAMDHLVNLRHTEYDYNIVVGDYPHASAPILELRRDPHVNNPSNGVSTNMHNEITYVQVKLSNSSGKSNFFTEIWEGTTNSYEVGGASPPVTTNQVYNEFADELYSINYLGLPNTKY